MHWELHSATNAMLIAPPVADHAQRIYQVFGKETLDQLIPLSATAAAGSRRSAAASTVAAAARRRKTKPQTIRCQAKFALHGFVSRPEIQKLNRNSIFIFVNGRLIRDRLVQHALTEAYRNIIPPTVFPVVLLFLEMPATEVDVNVHPSKTEVRFRQSSILHDFIRDSVRAALMKARPVPAFMAEIHAQPTASASLSPSARQLSADVTRCRVTEADAAFALARARAARRLPRRCSSERQHRRLMRTRRFRWRASGRRPSVTQRQSRRTATVVAITAAPLHLPTTTRPSASTRWQR